MKKRILSLFMACCIVLGSLILSPEIFAADTLVLTDHGGMYGAHLLSRTEITKNGDGSFDVTIDMYTYYAVLKQNTNLTSSTDDYYVVDRDGKYLVELWGGDGASIGSATGGLGGYTYSVLNLKVGDVLYYTLVNDDKIIVRPSGTEPKIKIYVLAHGDDSASLEAKVALYEKDSRKMTEV